MTPVTQADTLDKVREYYGRVLSSSRDLKSGACCTPESLPSHLRSLLQDIHPEVQDRFYGCGVPLPPALEGATVLDLGCGSGRDCYLLSRLVGEDGRVLGVDMTREQLEVAEAHREWHAQRYGFQRSNVEFLEGMMEDLAALRIEDASVDVVVSNCVINLSPDKDAVFREAFRVLKPGGRFHVSDIVLSRELSDTERDDLSLWAGCAAGALLEDDYLKRLVTAGFGNVRVDSRSSVGEKPWYSATISAGKRVRPTTGCC